MNARAVLFAGVDQVVLRETEVPEPEDAPALYRGLQGAEPSWVTGAFCW